MDDWELPRPVRFAVGVTLTAALAVIALVTLVPTGRGWSWGSPSTELRWYVTGLHSGATVLQLVGNLSLLVVPTALAVLLWPSLRQVGRLVPMAFGVAATIEILQWALPLGRVVSPLDAALNATGAIGAGLLVAAAVRLRGHPAPTP